jgi:pheromone shutdown protein TraB
VWRVIDAASGKRVVLVGTMHGNPASSNLAATVIKEEVPRAVLVELCDARWNVTAVSERARERERANEERYRERKRESARSRERAREREVEREAGQLRT